MVVVRSRVLLGMILVLAGLIFFLDAADVIPARSFLSNWWPVLIIGLGFAAILSWPRSWVGGGILIASGFALLFVTLDVFDISLWQMIIPLFLLGAGITLVLRGFGIGGRSDRRNRVNMMSVLGEQRIRSEASAFRRASLTSVLAEVKLDLRNATLDPSGAVIDTFCLLGDIDVIVPRGWRVNVIGMPILGDFTDNTAHDPDLPVNAPEITITGVSMLADIDVSHS